MNALNDLAHPVVAAVEIEQYGAGRRDLHHVRGGLTKREHYAGLAMAALIGTANGPCLVGGLMGAEAETAKAAFRMADAMLAAGKVES